MPVLPEGPLSRASHSSLFPAQHAPCPRAQLQALLHFLIDQLKLFLIGCVPIATKGCDILRPLLDGSPGGSIMRCPSCGALIERSDCCTECGLQFALNKDQAQEEATLFESASAQLPALDSSPRQQQTRKSTLIEFPGSSRSSVPEWRKGLSERVREVQERRLREAEREAAEANRRRLEVSTTTPPQLELLPQAEMPALNPLVAAALRRIERAHQPTAQAEMRSTRTNSAVAVAYAPETVAAPETEEIETDRELVASAPPVVEEIPSVTSDLEIPVPQPEKTHNLVMVAATQAPATSKIPSLPTPRRLIFEDPNDPALNYLDSISKEIRVDELKYNKASVFRRLICGLLDLGVAALLCSPFVIGLRLMGNDLHDVRTILFSIGVFIVVTFLYLTLSIALTGRTWAMRLFGLRVIDTKTGLIPTGGQSAGRALIYLLSLCGAGLGILAALLSPEGYTAHDRTTRTAVIAR